MRNANEMKIEGMATLSENGFCFDSGLPHDEYLLEKDLELRGRLNILRNGSALFHRSTRVVLPPEVNQVTSGTGYFVKRTNRNYIIHIKVPVLETRRDTQRTLDQLMPVILGEITLDRAEVLGELTD